jgi:hypothetical protein
VFYQIAFEQELAPNEKLVFGNRSIPIAEVLDLYARRTGAHISTADIYSRGITLPDEMPNHEVHHHVLTHFGVPTAPGAVKQGSTSEQSRESV